MESGTLQRNALEECQGADLPHGVDRRLDYVKLPANAPVVKSTGFLGWLSLDSEGPPKVAVPRAFYAAAVSGNVKAPSESTELNLFSTLSPVARLSLATLQKHTTAKADAGLFTFTTSGAVLRSGALPAEMYEL